MIALIDIQVLIKHALPNLNFFFKNSYPITKQNLTSKNKSEFMPYFNTESPVLFKQSDVCLKKENAQVKLKISNFLHMAVPINYYYQWNRL